MITTVPVRVPVVVGVKETLMVQFPPIPSAIPAQLFVSAKSPLIVTVEIFSVAVPEFVRVMDWAVLVVPTVCDEKVSDVGFRVAAGAPTAVPVNVIVCGEVVVLSVRMRLPDLVPVAVGVNVTEIVHGVFGAMFVGQLFVNPKSLSVL